jgi:NADH-quinone oxidoreductase subunit G
LRIFHLEQRMAKFVTLTIDGIQVSVPEGTLIVDAAKKIGIDIPVFCYHPKMEPVGMCRMCLVEIGRPVIDRVTGQPVLEDGGNPKLQYGQNLETACTTMVSDGMVVLGMTEKAKAGRDDVIEFLLTSHPLDCPICDKGGECPLQNLTMRFGPGQSRYLYDEKMHQAKNVPLGDLIFLDRERCIQCGRCVRFQKELVDDPVIGFFHRGRALEIITCSEPGFNSYFSGNTTDICPVGALTTADFRFKARPWQMRTAASICNHCPVGCNISLNVRREAASGGEWVVKRVMPRQNEAVNEIWICDKGRFGYHFAGKDNQRLSQPLVRKDGELVPSNWDDAINAVAERFKQAGEDLFTLVGGRLTNEDLFNLRQITRSLGGETALYSHMAGGEYTTRVGVSPGTNFSDMGEGSAILVVASDLEEEAPIWWLRVKQATERGAKLILLNSRPTKLEQWAAYSIRYPFGAADSALVAILNELSTEKKDLPESTKSLSHSPELKAAAKAFAQAEDAVILYGSDASSPTHSQALAQACANLLVATGHYKRPNNGLIGVWPRANDQGAWELGLSALTDLGASMEAAQALYIVAADPAGDDPAYLGQAVFGEKAFVVVQDLFLTQTARLADVVFPVQSWFEREGSYTTGERRVQRFYPALPTSPTLSFRAESPGVNRAPLLSFRDAELSGPLADYVIPSLISKQIGLNDQITAESAAAVFNRLAVEEPVFAGLSYQKLAQVKEQWPIIGRDDLYYGGTTYENTQGLGVQLPLAEGDEADLSLSDRSKIAETVLPKLGLMAFPITRLYDRGQTMLPSQLLHQRIGEPSLFINPHDAKRIRIENGAMVQVILSTKNEGTTVSSTTGGEQIVLAQALIDEALPQRVVLVPRSFGIPVYQPTPVEVRRTD